ncbi:MAG: hypothetical protein WAV38_22455 [Xanthobacteraceae bacterium]
MFEPSGANPDDIYCRNIDPRLALLARAAAWLALVEHEAATLDEALEALTPAFYAITTSPCACDREMVERWERDYPPRPLRYRAGGVQ